MGKREGCLGPDTEQQVFHRQQRGTPSLEEPPLGCRFVGNALWAMRLHKVQYERLGFFRGSAEEELCRFAHIFEVAHNTLIPHVIKQGLCLQRVSEWLMHSYAIDICRLKTIIH